MFSAWKVAVIFTASNLAGPALANITSEAGKAEVATARLNKMLRGLAIAGGIGAIAVGVALEYGIGKGIQKAAELQSALTSLQITTNMSNAQLDKAHDLALYVTSQTSQSITQILEEFNAAVRGGFTPNQLTSGGGALFKKLAYLADVLYRTPGLNADPIDSIQNSAKLAHMFGIYDPKGTQNITEDIYAAYRTGPFDLNKMVTQGKYYISEFSRMGASVDDIMGVTTLMGQLGYMQGRGGTGLQATLLGIIKDAVTATTHTQKAKNKSLDALGLRQFIHYERQPDGTYKNHFEVGKMFSHLAEISKYMPAMKFAGLINNALGRMALPMTMAASMQSAFHQWLLIEQEQKNLKANMGIEKAQHKLVYETFKGAIGVLGTNLQSLWAELFLPLTKALTPVVGQVANLVFQLVWFVHEHPATAMKLTLGAAATGFALILGGATMLTAMLWRSTAAMIALGKAAEVTAVEEGAAGGGGWLGKTLRTVLGIDLMKGVISKAGLPAMEGVAGMASAAGPWLLRLLMRFIPIVGWVSIGVLLLDLFKAHAHDLGYIGGEIWHWLRTSLWPGVIDAAKSGFRWLGDTITGLFTGKTEGGIWNWIKSIGKGVQDTIQGFKEGDADHPATRKALHKHIQKHVQRHLGGASGTWDVATPEKTFSAGQYGWFVGIFARMFLDNIVNTIKSWSVEAVKLAVSCYKLLAKAEVGFFKAQLQAYQLAFNGLVKLVEFGLNQMLDSFRTFFADMASLTKSIPNFVQGLIKGFGNPFAPKSAGHVTIHVSGAGHPEKVADAVVSRLNKHVGLYNRAQPTNSPSHPYMFDSLLGYTQ